MYRSSTIPAFQGRYVYCLNGKAGPKVLSIDAADPTNGPTIDHTATLGVDAWPNESLHGLGRDDDGELYLMRVTSGLVDNGTIFKIIP